MIGATLPAALNLLTGAGLTVANASLAPSRTIASGSVVSTTPAPGAAFVAPAPVDIVVSSGSGGWKELIAQNYQSIIFNGLAVGVLFVLAAGLWVGGAEFYARLADQSTAADS